MMPHYMYRIRLLLLLLLLFLSTSTLCKSSSSSPAIDLPKKVCTSRGKDCEREEMSFKALSELHGQLDDDKDGGVDPEEADEFVRDELHYTDGFERTKSFHSVDNHISKEELWKSWKNSAVYNWTVNDVINWLVETVELPQYAELFLQENVDGPTLPRLAVLNMTYLTSTLKIKNTNHKQKIMFKAMDAVLFGAPKKGHNYVKDMTLAASLLIAMGGCWFAFIQYRFSQRHMARMAKDLDSLSRAENFLLEMQNKLDEAEKTKAKVHEEKQEIEQKYKSEVEKVRREATRFSEERLDSLDDDEHVKHLEHELDILRDRLEEAESRAEAAGRGAGWTPPVELQLWLQLSFEVELQYFNTKKAAAEHQLLIAREWCEKLRKKKNAFMGSLRIAHSSNLDDVDKRITEAREALDEVRQDLQERLHRWSQIEALTGFTISSNPGVTNVRSHLRDGYLSGSAVNLASAVERLAGGRLFRPSSQDNILDEIEDDPAEDHVVMSTEPNHYHRAVNNIAKVNHCSSPNLVGLQRQQSKGRLNPNTAKDNAGNSAEVYRSSPLTSQLSSSNDTLDQESPTPRSQAERRLRTAALVSRVVTSGIRAPQHSSGSHTTGRPAGHVRSPGVNGGHQSGLAHRTPVFTLDPSDASSRECLTSPVQSPTRLVARDEHSGSLLPLKRIHTNPILRSNPNHPPGESNRTELVKNDSAVDFSRHTDACTAQQSLTPPSQQRDFHSTNDLLAKSENHHQPANHEREICSDDEAETRPAQPLAGGHVASKVSANESSAGSSHSGTSERRKKLKMPKFFRKRNE